MHLMIFNDNGLFNWMEHLQYQKFVNFYSHLTQHGIVHSLFGSINLHRAQDFDFNGQGPDIIELEGMGDVHGT